MTLGIDFKSYLCTNLARMGSQCHSSRRLFGANNTNNVSESEGESAKADSSPEAEEGVLHFGEAAIVVGRIGDANELCLLGGIVEEVNIGDREGIDVGGHGNAVMPARRRFGVWLGDQVHIDLGGVSAAE